MHKPLLAFARWVVPSVLSWSAAAQCSPIVPPGGLAGFDVPAQTMIEWDPDGAGPLGVHWLFGGKFGVAGGTLANGVALHDPLTGQWSTLGSGLAGVRRFLPLANGQLLATAGQWPWLWDGSQWQPLPGAPSTAHQVNAMVLMPNGDLVVGGQVSLFGGAYLARWNGSNWAPLGTGVTGSVPSTNWSVSYVSDLLVDSTGDLWVGGAFTTAGSVAARNIARWDGVAWFDVGGGLQEPPSVSSPGVQRLVQLPQGDVVAIGRFTNAGGTPVNGAARWDGSAWQSMAGGLPPSAGSPAWPVDATLDATGDVWVASGALLRWDGTSWHSLPTGTGPEGSVSACTGTAGGALVVSGPFRSVQSVGRVDTVAALDSGSWSRLPGPTDGELWGPDSLFGSIAGEVVAIRRNGGSQVRTSAGWTPLVGAPTFPYVSAVCNLANGDLVVGVVGPVSGWPWSFAGQPYGPLIRYDGSTWTPFGGFGIEATASGSLSLRRLLPLRDGTLAAAGAFRSIGGVSCASVARWNGSAWLPFGSGISGEVRATLQLSNGDLVVGGSFYASGSTLLNNVARWNGSSWIAMGTGIGSWPSTLIEALIELPNGDLLATVSSSSGSSVVRWDGTAWVDASPGQAMAVVDAFQLPSREVLLAVQLPNAIPSQSEPRLLIGDGLSPWRDFSAQPTKGATSLPWRCHLTPSGELLVQGPFCGMGGQPSVGLASIFPGCPAIANVVGTGCAGSNGQDTLTSEVLPWLGGVARARATGLPNEAMVVVTLGLSSPNVTLGSLSPLAQPSCQLLAALDFYVLANVTGGSVPIDLPLPLTPALVGASLFEQVLSLGFTNGAPFEATSTNALELQLGLFGG